MSLFCKINYYLSAYLPNFNSKTFLEKKRFAKWLMQIVIIGAGASGIGAARTLIKSGANVVILEGRDRIGGRMHKVSLTKNLLNLNDSEKSDFYVTVQLGANWIHGLDVVSNPMYDVALKLGLELHQTSSDDDPGDDVLLFDSEVFTEKLSSEPYRRTYSKVSSEDYHDALKRYEWMKDYVDLIQPDIERDISLQNAFNLALEASVKLFGPCNELHERCLNWFFDRVSIDLGAHIAAASYLVYNEGVSDGLGGEALVVHGGYSSILDHLAFEYPLDIRLNHTVTSIKVNSVMADTSELIDTASTNNENNIRKCSLKDGHFVSIECSNGEIIFADACLVTVPVGILQTGGIRFHPHAPTCISNICASVKQGTMNLVWLWYPSVFWPSECNFLGLARRNLQTLTTSTPVKFSTFLVPKIFDNQGNRQPILMCQIVGPYATTIESMTDREIADEATATLRCMFGGSSSDDDLNSTVVVVPDPIGCIHSAWGADPYSLGSWTYFPYRDTTTAAANATASSNTVVDCFTSSLFNGTAPVVVDTLLSAGGAKDGGDNGDHNEYESDSDTNDSTDSSSRDSSEEEEEDVDREKYDNSNIFYANDNRDMIANDRGGDCAMQYHQRNSIDSTATSILAVSLDDSVNIVKSYVPSNSSSSSSRSCANYCNGNNSSYSSIHGSGAGCHSTSSSSMVMTNIDRHVYYSGEAMSVINRGTVHGAYLSGIHEAQRILQQLS